MKQRLSRNRSRPEAERPSTEPRLRPVPSERSEEDAAIALIERIRPRPLPWTPPSAA